MNTQDERNFALELGYMQGAGPEIAYHLFSMADEIDRLTAERDALLDESFGLLKKLLATQAERDAAQADAKRLEWLSQQGVSFGFQDIYEGNKWEIGGPYATLRIAIDAEMESNHGRD